ncbi:MAG: hypothetical protein WC683_17725 [bacterium]
MAYIWDPTLLRFRDERGRFVTNAVVEAWRETATDAAVERARNLATQVAGGQIDVAAWQNAMRTEIKNRVIQEYLLGRGPGLLTPADRGSLGGMLTEQYRYLDRFAVEIAAGNLSEAQISARAAMYIRSAHEAYGRAQARARHITLPAYPGDGNSRCLTNCGCHWEFHGRGHHKWDCYWVLGDHEHCVDCLDNASKWNPYTVRGGEPG